MPDELTDDSLSAHLVRGLQPTRVTLVEHDPRWADRFAARARRAAPGAR